MCFDSIFSFIFQFNRTIVAQENNASDDLVNRGQTTKHNRLATKFLNFSEEKPSTPILDTINYPMHMKNLSIEVINHEMMLLYLVAKITHFQSACELIIRICIWFSY